MCIRDSYFDESLFDENDGASHGGALQPLGAPPPVIPSALASTSLKNKIINNINKGKESAQTSNMKRDKKIDIVSGNDGENEINQR